MEHICSMVLTWSMHVFFTVRSWLLCPTQVRPLLYHAWTIVTVFDHGSWDRAYYPTRICSNENFPFAAEPGLDMLIMLNLHRRYQIVNIVIMQLSKPYISTHQIHRKRSRYYLIQPTTVWVQYYVQLLYI